MPDQSPPEILYHYTTQEALLKIFEGRKCEQEEERKYVLRATKIQYMNDASELVAPLKIADEILAERDRRKDVTEEEKGMIQALRSFIDIGKDVNVCSVSFSGEPDDLSQWRAYGGDGSGYAIGFDRAQLEAHAAAKKCKLRKCEYEPKRQRKVIESTISVLIKSALLRSEFPPHTIDAGSLYEELVQVALMMKSKPFAKEHEWRIVSAGLCSYLNCHFRHDKSKMIPYWHFPLDLTIIRRIFIGPTQDPMLAKKAVEGLLLRNDLDPEDKVKNSGIAFRG